MRRLSHTAAFLLLVLAAGSDLLSQDPNDYILAAHRTGVAELIEPGTLATVARLHFDFHVEKLFASADGWALYVDGYGEDGCCSHYRVDLESLKLAKVQESEERNDSQGSLISADGRWRVELISFRGPVLKMFDRRTGAVQELVPDELPLTEETRGGKCAAEGTRSGDRFYFYVACPSHPGLLWAVTPGATQLSTALPLAPFNDEPGCRHPLPVGKVLVAAGKQLFLYEAFGSKFDRTRGCPTPLPGGAWMVDPATGSLSGQIGAGFHFNALIPDRSGSTFYGVDPGDSAWRGPVQLVELEGQDYQVVKSRVFDPGVLQIATGRLRQVPAGDVTVR